MEWITTYTIGQAKHLLSQTDLSIKEIAEQLGFPEQFAFRKYLSEWWVYPRLNTGKEKVKSTF